MKKFTAIATLAAASTVNAWDPEFLRGAQTGMFLTSEQQFEDYSCPPANISPQIQTYIDMAKPMQMMMQNMNKNNPQASNNPILDLALNSASSVGKISGVFDENYDGGEFCKGLLFSKEASKIVFTLGNQMMGNNSNSNSQQRKPVDQKKLALESRGLQ